jgi:hypothetical protein
MVSTFPYDGNFQQAVQDFREQARAQPGQVKLWLNESHKILNQMPQSIQVRTPNGVLRAKRDMITSQPYHHGYLELCQELPDWEATDSPQTILQASAMIAALQPLKRSWKRKSGGKQTLSKSQ